jgi:hypothetical protein
MRNLAATLICAIFARSRGAVTMRPDAGSHVADRIAAGPCLIHNRAALTGNYAEAADLLDQALGTFRERGQAVLAVAR